jgi:hypothetical protein
VALLDELSSWICKMDSPRILRQVLELNYMLKEREISGMIPNEMVQSHTKRHQGNRKDTKKTVNI